MAKILSFPDAAKGPHGRHLFEVFMMGTMGCASDGLLDVRAQTMPPRIADCARAEIARRERLEAE